jgi:hypothetical protein
MSKRGVSILDLARLHHDFARKPRRNRSRWKRAVLLGAASRNGTHRIEPLQGRLFESENSD